jgi:FdhE protein
MSGTNTGVGIGGRFSAHEVPIDPSSQVWLRLLDVAIDAATDPAWAALVMPNGPADRPKSAPCIHGAQIDLDAYLWLQLARRLARTAAESTGGELSFPHLHRLDPESLVVAAIAQDTAAVADLASRVGADVGGLGALGQFAVIPLLSAFARRFAGDVPSSWLEGYCPICGRWPSMCETRGLERSRHFRCGSCGSDWPMPHLTCAFCGENDHRRLGSLVLEGEAVPHRVDTCETCRGYLKTVTSLSALPFRVLAMEDLRTVPLDLVAHERGYARPERPGYAVEISVRVRNTLPNGVMRWHRSLRDK